MAHWALITGGSQRIGAHIARILHQHGWHIAIHCHQGLAQAKQLASELNQHRVDSACVFQADLSDDAARMTFAAEMMAALPHLNVLINNAAVFFPTPLDSITPQQAREILNTNLLAPYFLAKDLMPLLQQDQGSIINMLDIHGQRPLFNHGLYSISKAGLEMATRSLAQELAPTVRVNGIAPGAIIWPDGSQTASQQQVMQQIPLGRCGQAEDIAQLVLFLTRAPYITGQIIAVDGGRSATGYIGAE
ncbi:pteridine reductase [Shewanella sp. NFH-SH190041]|uniref:pteridine reductase n=1 Tax=Shewanella sp. NFH-SH190041 TaxID=2950245 RepID=UPI0021C2ECEC|nr:pteridine reductase [Shewanella sp. NFH-SH190041]BDM64435.1 pteridine reductase [Shewanella sp. NFH-SH190041]